MKLLTKELMLRIPFDVRNVQDPPAVVKFFNPAGAGTWYGAEAQVVTPDGQEKPLSAFTPEELDDPLKVQDVIFFGAAELFEFELGSFSLGELKALPLPFGLRIERDKFFGPTPLSKCRGK